MKQDVGCETFLFRDHGTKVAVANLSKTLNNDHIIAEFKFDHARTRTDHAISIH